MSKRDYTINSWGIRMAMFGKKMTQEDLAKKTGLSTSTISNILNRTSWSIPSLRKVAKALRIKWDTIIVPIKPPKGPRP